MGNREVVWGSGQMNKKGCERILEGDGAVSDLTLVIMTLVFIKAHRTKHE